MGDGGAAGLAQASSTHAERAVPNDGSTEDRSATPSEWLTPGCGRVPASLGWSASCTCMGESRDVEVLRIVSATDLPVPDRLTLMSLADHCPVATTLAQQLRESKS